MKPKLAVILALIVLVPLALLAWLGARMLTAEREVLRHQFTELLTARLRDTDQTIARFMDERERQLLRLTNLPTHNTETLRELTRSNPLISQVFVLSPKGDLLHPPPSGQTDAEREFMQRAARFLSDKTLVHASSPDAQTTITREPEKGWYVWYWENGLSLIFWRRGADGHVVGVELERARLMADVIARLPDNSTPLPRASVALTDANGAVIYRWGEYTPAASEKAPVELALSPPLSSWHLHYFAPPSAFGAGPSANALLAFAVEMLVAAAAILALAVYLHREYSRDVREAAQRVNFVNQVSHELKTPLTNIRMYAELLDNELPDAAPEHAADADKTRRYLGIIVSESQRLSRLIGNVLTFARQQRKTLSLHRQSGTIDALIDATLEQHRPALEAKGIRVCFERGAGETVLFDPDAVGQILGNLFNNAEKYAALGGELIVISSQTGTTTRIIVADRGPGIPENQRAKIFQPFYRVSSKLSDGVTGTGIGLSIARELARLHGGDVVLEDSPAGARFRVTITHAPAARASIPEDGTTQTRGETL